MDKTNDDFSLYVVIWHRQLDKVLQHKDIEQNMADNSQHCQSSLYIVTMDKHIGNEFCTAKIDTKIDVMFFLDSPNSAS